MKKGDVARASSSGGGKLIRTTDRSDGSQALGSFTGESVGDGSSVGEACGEDAVGIDGENALDDPVDGV
jgi:hypothetical protein